MQLDLSIVHWIPGGRGFTFRIPHATPNIANRVLVRCEHALGEFDENWTIGYPEGPIMWEHFCVQYLP